KGGPPRQLAGNGSDAEPERRGARIAPHGLIRRLIFQAMKPDLDRGVAALSAHHVVAPSDFSRNFAGDRSVREREPQSVLPRKRLSSDRCCISTLPVAERRRRMDDPRAPQLDQAVLHRKESSSRKALRLRFRAWWRQERPKYRCSHARARGCVTQINGV